MLTTGDLVKVFGSSYSWRLSIDLCSKIFLFVPVTGWRRNTLVAVPGSLSLLVTLFTGLSTMKCAEEKSEAVGFLQRRNQCVCPGGCLSGVFIVVEGPTDPPPKLKCWRR